MNTNKMNTKICSRETCEFVNIEQDINNFLFRKDKDRYNVECIHCQKIDKRNVYLKNKKSILEQSKVYYKNNKPARLEYRKKYYAKNKDIILNKMKNDYKNNKEKFTKRSTSYYKNNKSKILEYHRIYRINNKEKISYNSKIYYEKNKYYLIKMATIYYKNNKSKLLKQSNIRHKKRKLNDVSFKLKCRISNSIWYALKQNNSSKNGISCLKYLKYTINELKQYLESKFESWMTWDNQGIYVPALWDDQNQLTWKWQLDHIIPQFDLPYTSMADDNFKKCWGLENLRPYSAKQNLLDGINRTRHNKERQ